MTMLVLLKLRRWFTGLIVLGGACILLYTYHGLVKCNCDEHKSTSKRRVLDKASVYSSSYGYSGFP